MYIAVVYLLVNSFPFKRILCNKAGIATCLLKNIVSHVLKRSSVERATLHTYTCNYVQYVQYDYIQ
jgi:hypothetical protein